MILFIQGASHAGKTLLAGHIAKAAGSGILSTDLLKMGFIRSGNSGFAGLTPEDDEAIAEKLRPVLRETALAAHENGQPLDCEGVSLPFEETARPAEELGVGNAAVFAIVFAESYIRSHYPLICRKARAAERRVRQESPRLHELLADHTHVRGKAMGCGRTLLEIQKPGDWERKIGRLGDISADILAALHRDLASRPAVFSRSKEIPTVCQYLPREVLEFFPDS